MRVVRFLAAGLPIALALFAFHLYRLDREARGPVIEAFAEFSMDERRPLELEMARNAPSPDWAAQVFAIAAIDDALGRVNLATLPARERELWLRTPERLDLELEKSRELLLHAVAARPGWAYYRYLLGKTVYVSDRRLLPEEVDPRLWLAPLRSASLQAPGEDAVANTFAAVFLESWQLLPGEVRREAPAAIRRALLDREFASRAYLPLLHTLGGRVSASLLPADPEVLHAAASAAARGEEIEHATLLRRAWREAEWRARERDLGAIERRAERKDRSGVLLAINDWLARHSIHDFDHAAGRSQVGRIAAAWPADRFGNWLIDPRGELVRYFLDHRVDSVEPRHLEALTAPLSNVPETVSAHVALLAGRAAEARRIAERSLSRGSFEWTPFYLALARHEMKRGDLAAAREAFRQVPATAAGECDVEILARELDRDAAPRPLQANLALPPGAWSSDGRAAVCVDPEVSSNAFLEVRVLAPRPVIVAWGWDGGRAGEMLVRDAADVISEPLAGRSGRHTFAVTPLFGGEIEELWGVVGPGASN